MTGVLKSLRRRLISAPLLAWYRKVLPSVSATERQALEAGTVGWDAELFSGRPDWEKFLATPTTELTAEEQAFLDGPVEELCRMLDDWEINYHLKDLPPQAWEFIKDQGFWGMIIPKEYGGKGFSALAHSSVIMKMATRNISAAVTVMVPNSLGPAELLLSYGTEEQKNYYLPRLAQGEELPCFAMTGPHAGSDAASMPDDGIVCYQEFQGKRTLGMRVTWDKRYITLGPVATLLGLAFRLYDPDHLLGDQQDLGITLVLVPTDTPGVNIGRRHYPAYQAFQNGPTSGKDVFMPLDWIIGGQDYVGQGWRMLMECLAAGRSISLPSLSTGAVKFCARTSGAYARVRKQFKLPVGKFEGVQEALTPMAGYSYILDAARRITATAVDLGEKPSVLSAIIKYHATVRMREAVNYAMDIHGGKAICDGPSNYLSNIYYAIPVSITVEGANILTRSMIVFGQGSLRCHPYLLKEMRAAQNSDEKQGLIDFDRALFGHLGFHLRNLGRALWHNLTGGRWARAPQAGPATDYYRQLSRASASFAWLADLTLMVLGGKLKREERLSARLGDILSSLYLLSCVLKRFETDGRPDQDLPLLHWCGQTELYTIQQRFDEVLTNFPSRPLVWLARRVIFPFGMRRTPPSDRLGQQCAELLLTPSEVRDRLTAGIFVSYDPEDITGCLEYALERVLVAEAVEEKLRKAGFTGTVEEAVSKGVITDAQARLLEQAEQATRKVIEVDDFAPQELTGETSQWQKQPQPTAQSMS